MAALAELLADLRAAADPVAHPNRHYRGSGAVLGVRMGTLFDIAARHAQLPIDELEQLLDTPEYEPRMAAFCVMDFAVRVRGVDDDRRHALFDLYLRRHDAIDDWGMVDRAAPRVVGGWLVDKPRDALFELAASADPLRRRTAMTAPLFYTRGHHPAALLDLYRLASLLLGDRDPLVSKPVGIALRHAGAVDPDGVRAFLAEHGDRVPAPVARAAREKLGD
jgi:3-methyladenine DNA glycosylase AlkD